MIDSKVDSDSCFSRRYLAIDKMCYAKLLRYCYLKNNINLSDSQPEVLTEELVEGNHPSPKPCYPIEIPLISCKEKLNCCKGALCT